MDITTTSNIPGFTGSATIKVIVGNGQYGNVLVALNKKIIQSRNGAYKVPSIIAGDILSIIATVLDTNPSTNATSVHIIIASNGSSLLDLSKNFTVPNNGDTVTYQFIVRF